MQAIFEKKNALIPDASIGASAQKKGNVYETNRQIIKEKYNAITEYLIQTQRLTNPENIEDRA